MEKNYDPMESLASQKVIYSTYVSMVKANTCGIAIEVKLYN